MDPGADGLAVVVPLLIMALGDVCHVKNRVCSHFCAFLHRTASSLVQTTGWRLCLYVLDWHPT